MPSRKWPDPHAGSMVRSPRSGSPSGSSGSSRTALRPNSSIAGSSVRSRMNSSTNSGGLQQGVHLAACSLSSW